MSKRQWLCLLGVWVMVFTFLGVSAFWHQVVAVISGLVIVTISYNLPHQKRDSKADSFSENNIVPNI